MASNIVKFTEMYTQRISNRCLGITRRNLLFFFHEPSPAKITNNDPPIAAILKYNLIRYVTK